MTEHQDFFAANAALGRAEVLDVPAMELLITVERTGRVFYEQLAERIGNDEAAELLRRNGREEVGHANRIRRAIALKRGGEYEPSPEVLEPLAVPLPDDIDVDVLPLIVQGELDGNLGYQRWADRETDPEVARLLRQNGVEETVHGERVERVIAILREDRSTEAS
jgi:rubrerythrin